MTWRFSVAWLAAIFGADRNTRQRVPVTPPPLDFLAPHAEILNVHSVEDRRDSVIVLATIDAGNGAQNVVVKQHRKLGPERTDSAKRARNEFETLQSLREQLSALPADVTGDVTYGVPRPLILDAPRGAVVMELAAGQQLEIIVRHARNFTPGASGLLDPLRRAGQWLRLMQQVTRRREDGHARLQQVVDEALHHLAEASAKDRVVRRHATRITATLRELARHIDAKALPLVGRHGDFSSGNIFVSDHRIDVIDFEGFGDGLPLDDAAFFLVHLELYFVYPFFGRYLPRLTEAFLDAYRGSQPLDERTMRFFVIAKALQFLAKGGLAKNGVLQGMWRKRALHRAILRRLQ